MYIRFATLNLDADTGKEVGVLVAGHTLRDEGDLSVDDHRELRLCLKWFNDNLSVPSTETVYTVQDKRALSWFKPSAVEHIRRMWELKSVLDRHDIHVAVLKTNQPGKILFEDDLQLIALPRKGQVFR